VSEISHGQGLNGSMVSSLYSCLVSISILLSEFSSINQISTIGLVGILGRLYIGAIMTGPVHMMWSIHDITQAVAGVFSTCANVIAVFVGPVSTGECLMSQGLK